MVMGSVNASRNVKHIKRALEENGDITSDYLILGPIAIFAAVGIFLFFLFCCLRRRVKIYYPRLLIKNARPPDLPTGFFTWIVWLFRLDEAKYVDVIGLDAVAILLFLRMGLSFFCALTPLGLLITLFNYFPNSPQIDNPGFGSYSLILRATTFENVTKGSWVLYVHLVAMWIVSICAYTWILVYYRKVIALRRKRIVQILESTNLRQIEFRSIMVNNVPVELRSESKLKLYFEELGLGEIEALSLYRPCLKLKRSVLKRWKCLTELERQYYVLYKRCEKASSSRNRNNNSERPIFSIQESLEAEELMLDHPVSQVTTRMIQVIIAKLKEYSKNGVPYKNYNSDVAKFLSCLQKFLAQDYATREMRKTALSTNSPTSVAFITFRDPASALSASQAHHTLSFLCNSRYAPEPRDIYWSNIESYSSSASTRVLRSWTIRIIHLLLVIFSAAIIVTVSFIVSVQSLKENYPSFYNFVFSNRPYLEELFKRFMPTIVAAGYTSCLPSLLSIMSLYQGSESKSWIEASLLSKYFFYQIYNIVIVQTIASRLWSSDKGILGASISEVMDYLGILIPANSPQFIKYVALHCFVVFPIELISADSIQFAFLLNLFRLTTTTPRNKSHVIYPSNLTFINYGIAYPAPILIFCIGVICSAVAPFIIPFCAIYFAIALLVRKYVLFYENMPKYESNGQHFARAIIRAFWGVLLMQLTMTGAIILKFRNGNEPPSQHNNSYVGRNHPETKFLKFWLSPNLMVLLISFIPMMVMTIILFTWTIRGYDNEMKTIPLGLIKYASNCIEKRTKCTKKRENFDESSINHNNSLYKKFTKHSLDSIFEVSRDLRDATNPICFDDTSRDASVTTNTSSSAANSNSPRYPRKTSRSYYMASKYLTNVHAEPPSYYIKGILEPPADTFSTLTGCNPYFWYGLKAIIENKTEKRNNKTTPMSVMDHEQDGLLYPHPKPPTEQVNFLDELLPRCSENHNELKLDNKNELNKSNSHQSNSWGYLENLCEYEDLVLHCYINPVIIGRFPTPWLAGDILNDPVFAAVRFHETIGQWSNYCDISSSYLDNNSSQIESEMNTQIQDFIKRIHISMYESDLPFRKSLKLIVLSIRNWMRTKI